MSIKDKDIEDAPSWYDAAEAVAWVNGFNECLRQFRVAVAAMEIKAHKQDHPHNTTQGEQG